MADGISSRLSHLFAEFRRRRVFRVATVYAVVGWVLIQLAANTFPALRLPAWAHTLVIVLIVLGFLIAVVLAWAFDVTREGVKRTPPAARKDRAGPRIHPRTGVRDLLRVFRGPRDAAAAPGAGPARGGAAPAPERGEPAPEQIRRASLAHVHHELRTPIDAIIGYSEMLLGDLEQDDPSNLGPDLRRIREAGRQLLALVSEIFHPTLWSERADERSLQELGAELHARLRTPLNAVIGYAEMLRERCRELDREHLVPDLERILTASRAVLANISDIVKLGRADRPDTFESPALKRASALVQSVLPKMRSQDAGGPAEPEVGAAAILVVDDNPTNRDLFSRQLARQGFTVSTASGGREALALLETDVFDLVLLDILMPEVDGVEVLRRMKADATLRAIPVIVISVLDDVNSIVRCIEMGAEDFVTKPFDPVLLRARIGSSLEVRRLRARERAYAQEQSRQREIIERAILGTLPGAIATRVRAGEEEIADFFPEATILYAAVQGLGRVAERAGATGVADALSELFGCYEGIAERYGAEVTRATGSSYLAALGVPTPRADHVQAAADLALELLDETDRYGGQIGMPLRLRGGLHTGPVVAGLLRERALAYEIWGEAVDTAMCLETYGVPGAIHVSRAVYARLQKSHQLDSRGVIDLAGKGQMQTYLLGTRLGAPRPSPKAATRSGEAG